MADKCEHTGTRGTCSNSKIEGSDFCAKHSNEADRIKGYRLSSPELRERFEHFSRVDLYASLRQEVDLLRVGIEERLSHCDTPAERISAFNAVHPVLVDIVKCMEKLNKLERQNNIVLGKEALAQLSNEIINILIGELEQVEGYERIVDRVAQRISNAVAESRNPE